MNAYGAIHPDAWFCNEIAINCSVNCQKKDGWPRLNSIRCETVTLPSLLSYLLKNAGSLTVSSISQTEPIEHVVTLAVPSSDFFEAFTSVPPDLLQQDGATISVSIIPAWGYVVRSITIEDSAGTVVQSFQSTDLFKDKDSGLFFPREWRRERHIGESVIVDCINISSMAKVNMPIPDKAFDLDIPKGTRVRDSRPNGEAVIFYTGDAKSLDQVDKDISKGVTNKSKPFRPKNENQSGPSKFQ